MSIICNKLVLLLSILLLAPPLFAESWADGRVARPVQLQLNIMGGGSVGVHLNEQLYLGAYQVNPYSLNTAVEDPSNQYEQTINNQPGMIDEVGYQSRRQVVEVRFSPWAVGLYFSGGYMRHEAESTRYYFDTRPRLVGSNAYTTGFQMQMDTPAYIGPVFGLGFNHVSENGFSFVLGGSVAAQPPKDTMVSYSDWDVDPAAADLAVFKSSMDDWAQSTPSEAFIIGLGYNF